MEIFEITKRFPAEEKYALTSQISAFVEISVLKPSGKRGRRGAMQRISEQIDGL